MLDFEPIELDKTLKPERKAELIEQAVLDQIEAAYLVKNEAGESVKGDIFQRLNAKDVLRLLSDYFEGFLAKQDNSLGLSRSRSGGGSSTLTNQIQAWQVQRVLRLMTYIRHRPAPDLPEHRGWHEHVLQCFKNGRNPWEYIHLPLPTIQHIHTALTVFAKLLYTECIKGGDCVQIQKEGQTQAQAA